MTRIYLIAIFLMYSAGCSMPATRFTSEEYQERPTLEASLFSSDMELLGEEAVERLLSSKIELPSRAKMAVMKFPSKRELSRIRYYYGRGYMQSEEYVNSQAMYFDALYMPLDTCKRLAEITLLPSLMVPNNANISVLREAAVRMQAELLLIYRVEGTVFEKYVFLGKDKVKAYATAEAILLDVRTGIIPFTFIATEVFEGRKGKKDLNNIEMIRPAEDQAIIKALARLGKELVEFLQSAP